MRIYPNGKRPDGTYIVPPMDQHELARAVLGGLDRNGNRLQRVAGSTIRAAAYHEQVAGRPSKNVYDPREAGWTVVLDETAPDAAAILEALAPLAVHRGVSGSLKPLSFSGVPQEAWGTWVDQHLSADDVDNRPEYVLIVGGPDRIPFDFQSLLDTTASVGRVDFSTPDELAAYVAKVIIEKAEQPVASRSAVFFAPDGDEGDAEQPRLPRGTARAGRREATRVQGHPAVRTRRHEAKAHRNSRLVHASPRLHGQPWNGGDDVAAGGPEAMERCAPLPDRRRHEVR